MLNLELKDIAKIDEVQACIVKVKKVLKLFWGQKRWPRNRLREVIKANHDGADWGLYRAKATRFAGNVREMARMLRAKNDLQEIVVSSEYQKQKQKFGRKTRQQEHDVEDDDAEDLEANIGDVVRSIVLDENDFWSTLVQILRVTTPIVVLLRLMDGDTPCMGSVYYRMFQASERMAALQHQIPWVANATKIHESRWEYLHSPFHAAAYALDPRFMVHAKDIDSHCQNGLFTVLQRTCIRDVMLELKLDVSTREKLEEAKEIVNANHPLVQERVAQGEREFGLNKRGASPFNRPALMLNSQKMAAHEFWELYGTQVPIIQSVEQRVLAQVASAFAAERNWSIYGQIKNEKRARLGHSRADARVYCHESIQLHEKLKIVRDCFDDEASDDDSDLDSNHSGNASELEDVNLEALMR